MSDEYPYNILRALDAACYANEEAADGPDDPCGGGWATSADVAAELGWSGGASVAQALRHLADSEGLVERGDVVYDGDWHHPVLLWAPSEEGAQLLADFEVIACP